MIGSRPGGVVGGAGLDLLQVPEGEGLLQLRPFAVRLGERLSEDADGCMSAP